MIAFKAGGALDTAAAANSILRAANAFRQQQGRGTLSANAQLAQAAIAEARRGQRKAPPVVAQVAPPMAPVRRSAFPSWARGAA